jgi:hypothetical protein
VKIGAHWIHHDAQGFSAIRAVRNFRPPALKLQSGAPDGTANFFQVKSHGASMLDRMSITLPASSQTCITTLC